MVETETKIQRYESYKDSGVEWLGDIPEHWDMERLGSILNPISSKNHPEETLLSITREQGVIVRGLEDEDDNHNYIPDDLSGYKLLMEGQFGMNKMKAWQGSYGVSEYTGIVSPAYYTFDFTKEIYPRFFHLAIRSKLYVSFFGAASDGVRVGQWDLSKDRMKMIPFAIPPLPEQTAIAQFLDDKTTKIDEAIAIKQQQIALLKERKQILIHKAVTKGVTSSAVEMKDSGVEWIGEIPEHWEVCNFRYLIKVLTDYTANGSFGDLAKYVTYQNEPSYSRLIRLTDLRKNLKKSGVYLNEKSHKYLSKSELFGGELLMANVGAYAGLAWIMPKIDSPASLAPNMFLIKPFENKIQMFQNEYREINENSNFYTSFNFVNNYKSSLDKNKNSIFSIFTEYDFNLNLEKFISSDLFVKIEKVTKKINSKIIIKPIEEENLEHKKFLKEEMKKNFF